MGTGTKSKERRFAPRKAVRWRVNYWQGDGPREHGYTLDASATGVFIETLRVPNIGQRFHLEIKMGDDSHFAEGVVIRTVKVPRTGQKFQKSGFALRFVGLDKVLYPKRSAADQALRLNLRQPGRLLQVSEAELKHGGVFISTHERPDQGAVIPVAILLPKPHPVLAFKATVMQVMDDPGGVAVQVPPDVAAKVGDIAKEVGTQGVPLMLDLTDQERLKEAVAGQLTQGLADLPLGHPLPTRTKVDLTVGLPPPAAPVTVRGTVVGSTKDPAGVTVQLGDPAVLLTALKAVLG